MMKKLYIPLALVCAVTSGGAVANWRYTSWNMTTDQALAASQGKLHKVDTSNDGRVGFKFSLAGSHDVAGAEFEIELGFDEKTGTLGIVNLMSLDEAACGRALAALKDKAQPEVESARAGAEKMTWRDASEGNLIRYSGNQTLRQYSDKEPACYLQYRPFNGPDAGL